jgi:hypothetical protein
MVYASNLQFVQRSGVGIRTVDENVGTGDGAELYFDLDHDNVIASSYTLQHAPSGQNNMTELTETTHYALDKESGRIVLTTDGRTALSTDILYATYWYTDIFSDTVITDYLAVADEEIDKLTGRKWDTPTLVSEYRNGRKSLGYPTTDRPYMVDWDAPDFIVLNQNQVTKIDHVYFLNVPLNISKFFNYDAGTLAYTDNTDAVNSSTETPFTLFDDSPVTGDYVYIGSEYPFLGLLTNLSTVGVDNGSTAIDWEYYNGSAWTDISETDVDTGASIFTVSGKFTWSYPYGWTKNAVNSTTAYWIRGKLTDDYSVDPICGTMSIVDSVNQILEPRNVSYSNNGIMNFMGVEVPNGTNNLRIDYYYGEASTPAYITELCVLMASVKAYVNLSGGSYDDATSYTLGSKSVTIGEVYVNIREVIDQFKKRIKEILDMVGKRADLVAI